MAIADRHLLADQIVTKMPSFGSWATAINEFETPFGKVGYRQLQLLWVIRHDHIGEEATASGMATLFQIQPSVVTRVLAKLEAHGFIVRTVDPADGRRMNITITQLGIELSDHVAALYHDEVLQQLELFSADEIARMAAAVDVLGTLGERLLNARKATITQQGHVAASHE